LFILHTFPIMNFPALSSICEGLVRRIVLMVRFLLKLCAFILLSAGMGYGIYFLDPVLDQASAASLLLANLLPALCLFLLCWGLTRRILLAFIISAGLVSLLFIINDNKILHLGEPLIFADAYLLPQMISGWDLMH